jgi:hypothetical protein
MKEEAIFHKGFWVQLGIIVALMSFLFTYILTNVNAQQDKQDIEIQKNADAVAIVNQNIATIKQQNIDIEKRLERIEDKLDTLLERGG